MMVVANNHEPISYDAIFGAGPGTNRLDHFFEIGRGRFERWEQTIAGDVSDCILRNLHRATKGVKPVFNAV